MYLTLLFILFIYFRCFAKSLVNVNHFKAFAVVSSKWPKVKALAKSKQKCVLVNIRIISFIISVLHFSVCF